MMPEQLVARQVKWEIMKRPSQNEESDDLVVFDRGGVVPEEEKGPNSEVSCDAPLCPATR